MLTIDIPEIELFDESKSEFFKVGPWHLNLEHSLKSVYKWESRTHRSFMDADQLTPEDLAEYIRCMTVNQIRDDAAYGYITPKDIQRILDYMKDPMSAKKFRPKKNQHRGSMCSEDIYAAMIQYGIPESWENRHFNQLIALIRTMEGTSGGGQQFKSYSEKQRFYRELNEARRKQLGTKG